MENDVLTNEGPGFEPDLKPNSFAFKYGLYGGLASILVGLVLYLLDLTDYSKTGGGLLTMILSYSIIIVTPIFAILAYRQALGGYISFKNAFMAGFLTSLIMIVISSIWSYVFMSFVAPDIMTTIQEAQITQMEERGMTEEQIEQAQTMMGNFMKPGFMALSALFFGAILAAILNLILAAIFQRK